MITNDSQKVWFSCLEWMSDVGESAKIGGCKAGRTWTAKVLPGSAKNLALDESRFSKELAKHLRCENVSLQRLVRISSLSYKTRKGRTHESFSIISATSDAQDTLSHG